MQRSKYICRPIGVEKPGRDMAVCQDPGIAQSRLLLPVLREVSTNQVCRIFASACPMSPPIFDRIPKHVSFMLTLRAVNTIRGRFQSLPGILDVLQTVECNMRVHVLRWPGVC